MKIRKTYRVRLYPNKAQEQKLLQTLGACRWVYNYFLSARKDYYREYGKKLSYLQMSKDLTHMRKNMWLGDIRNVFVQQSLRRVDAAYGNFFIKKNRFPRFKTKKDTRQSFQRPADWRIRGNKIQIQKDLIIRFRGRVNLEAELGTLIVSYRAEKWFASITAKETVKLPTRHTKPIGIDVGLKTLATLNTGQQFPNIQPQKTAQKRLAKAQRIMARRVKGSNRREKARVEVARAYEKIRNVRANHLHQVSAAITGKNHTLIAVEDLNVSGMLRNRKLARALGDAGLRELLRQIKYKQKWRGGQFVEVDRYFPSSKLCSACGFLAETMPLNIRTWKCGKCGRTHDRDVNAAKNILQEALAQRERGEDVRPFWQSSVKRGGR